MARKNPEEWQDDIGEGQCPWTRLKPETRNSIDELTDLDGSDAQTSEGSNGRQWSSP